MDNLLTDRSFWVNYWERKENLSVLIPENYLFHATLRAMVQREGIKTAIELGGFPGYYAVFLKKYLHLDVSLLDYFVHPPVTAKLLETNGLPPDAIPCIEADLFRYTPERAYDLVLSCGLIEHFNDTADIIQRHIAFLKPSGTLFITLPNFHALNGWFQKTFDRDNYDKHNLHCMDPEWLASLCRDAGLEVLQARYFGRFSIWLENEKAKPLGVRLFKKLTWLAGKALSKLIPVESRVFSPYILLEAKKMM